MGYGDYQNGQQGILNSLAIEFDVYQDSSMGDPNSNHVGVHSRGNNPNSSNETAVILNLVNTTIPAIQTGNGIQHTVYVEYQAVPNTLQVLLDGQQVLFSNAFNLTDWILLEPGTGESFIGITSSTYTNDFFELDILSWYFWQGNGTVVPASTQIYGPGYLNADFNQTNTYYIQLIDQFGYNLTQNQVTPTCSIAYGTDIGNLTNIACTATYISDGLYEATYNMTLTGQFTLITTVDTYTNTTLLTVTAPPFAANCVASGPGLTSAVAGELATFTITTYDATNALSTGDAAFAITLTLVSNNSIVFTGQASAPDGTGIYTATYNVTVSGDYSLSVVLVGQSDIQGSPFSVTVTAGVYSASNSYAYGPGITSGRAGDLNYFYVQATDAFGNVADSPSSWNITSGNGNAVSSVNSALVSDSTSVTNNTYVQTIVGNFPLVVTDVASGIAIQGSPFNVLISAGLASPTTTVANGSSTGTAGVLGTYTITPYDQFGNLVNDSSLIFYANFSGPAFYSTTGSYNTDGTYTCTYNLTVAGDYQVDIYLESGGEFTGYISSSPLALTIFAGAVSVQYSYATGQGLSYAQAGVAAGFTIQTVDEYNNTITTGNSTVFTITFDPSFNGTVDPVVPGNDGTYFVNYVAFTAGTFNLSVTSGSESILGSPFSVMVVAGAVSIPNSYATGEGLSTAQAGVTANFTIQTVDAYGNLNNYDNSTIFDVTFIGFFNGTVNPVVPNDDGTYFASYVSLDTGSFNLSVTSGSESIIGSPFTVVINPGPAAGNYSIPSGTGYYYAVAGANTTFIINAYDEFDNPIIGNGGPCTGYLVYEVNPLTNYTIDCTYVANNTYEASYNITVAGEYQLFVFINDESVQSTPSNVTVAPGALYAPASVATGPGVTQAVSGSEANFTITAKDQFGNIVPGAPLDPPPFNVTLTNGNNTVPGFVVYTSAGVYTVTYTLLAPTGNWSLDVNSFGVAISGSPFTVVLLPGPISAANCFAFPDPLTDGVAYENYFFLVQGVDINGNNEIGDVGVTFDAVITLDTDSPSLADIVVPSTYYQDGQYQFNFNLTSGQYTVAVSLNSTQIKNPFLPLTITAGFPAANSTIATGVALNTSRAGELSNFTITTYDLGGMAYTSGGQNFSVSLTLGTGNDTIIANDNVTITDNLNGTYAGQYYLTLVGTWELSINLTTGPYPGPINGLNGPSPFYPTIYPGPNCPENAGVMNLATNITVNDQQYFQIQSKDCYGNNVLSSGVYYDVLIEGPDCSFGNSSYLTDGLFNVTYIVSLPGNYSININERGTPINGSPYAVTATGGEDDIVVESGLSSTSLLYMWLMIVFLVLYVLFCLLLIGFVVFTQRKQLQRNLSNYKRIQSDSSSSSSSD